MGSNLKKIRSLNLNEKLFLLGIILSLGISGTFLLNNFLRDTYNSRKLRLEKKIEKFLNKKVDLGDYSGIRLLGISLSNPKIIDHKNINSEIKAQKIYVGIMPIKSFLNQKWILKIRPEKTEINVDKNFFQRNKSFDKREINKKSKIKFDLNFNLDKYVIFKLANLGLDTKVKGDFIYKSNTKQIIGNLKSIFDGKGVLKVKLNTKLNQDLLNLEIFSRRLNLENYEYGTGNRKFEFKKGIFESNFKFYKSSKQMFCKGGFL